MTAPLHWMFDDRRTGGITIAQWPNAPLWIWIVATLLDRLTPAPGWVGTVGTAALVVWAVLELAKGVNPWRRIVGGIVLLGIGASVL